MLEYSNGFRHANKAKMLRTQDSALGILLMEGDTDARFYGQFVCDRGCRILNCGGRSHALDAGDILAKDAFKGFVVLVDQDDWCVDRSAPKNHYLLTTDGRDLESTLLRGGMGLRLLAQYGDRSWVRKLEQKAGKSLLELLAEWTAVVGVVRWISNREGRKLTTRDVDITDFVDFDSLAVSVKGVAEQILRQSGGGGAVPFDKAASELVQKATDMLGKTKDKWVFCSGHDLCLALMRGLIRKFGTKESEKLTIEVFEASVRACCGPSEFAMTELFKRMQAWERHNAPFKLLADGATPLRA